MFVSWSYKFPWLLEHQTVKKLQSDDLMSEMRFILITVSIFGSKFTVLRDSSVVK